MVRIWGRCLWSLRRGVFRWSSIRAFIFYCAEFDFQAASVVKGLFARPAGRFQAGSTNPPRTRLRSNRALQALTHQLDARSGLSLVKDLEKFVEFVVRVAQSPDERAAPWYQGLDQWPVPACHDWMK